MKISVFFDHILQAVDQTGKSLPEILRKVRENGIEAVEIHLAYLCEHEEVMEQLERADLQISCIYEFYEMNKRAQEELAGKHIEMAVRVKAPNILVVPGFLPEPEARRMQECKDNRDAMTAFMDNNEGIGRMIREMSSICKMGTENGIRVTIEDFDDFKSPVSCINGIQYFLEHVPDLKYTLDMGNFAYSDEDVSEAWEVLKEKVVHVHCKDRGAVGETEHVTNKINRGLRTVAVGEGYMPIRELLEKIRSTGYDGYLAIEHFDAPDQESCMERSATFLKGVL